MVNLYIMSSVCIEHLRAMFDCYQFRKNHFICVYICALIGCGFYFLVNNIFVLIIFLINNSCFLFHFCFTSAEQEKALSGNFFSPPSLFCNYLPMNILSFCAHCFNHFLSCHCLCWNNVPTDLMELLNMLKIHMTQNGKSL